MTPNLFEAATLAGIYELTSVDDLAEAARRIADLGPRYVVVKGGVGLPGDEAIDVFFDGTDVTILRAPKVGDERVSGAGCVFAAATTAELTKGAEVVDAVRKAKEYTHAGIVGRLSSTAPFEPSGTDRSRPATRSPRATACCRQHHRRPAGRNR